MMSPFRQASTLRDRGAGIATLLEPDGRHDRTTETASEHLTQPGGRPPVLRTAQTIMSRTAILATALILALPTAALAQERPGIRPVETSRTAIGITGAMLVPLGEFDSYVGNGYGLGVSLLRKLDRSGAVQLRVEGGFVQYGHERESSCLVNCRISVDITTSNDIVVFGVGPQLMVPVGPVRPYITGTAGLAYFFTHSSLEGSNNDDSFADTKNFDDLVFAWTGGGGLQIPVRQGAKPISIDLGVRYHGNGKASYLREGSIENHDDGSITINPIRSKANFLSINLGVAFGF